MKWKMAVMAWLMLVSLVFSESCAEVQDQVRSVAIRLDYLITLNQNQVNALNDKLIELKASEANQTNTLFVNQDVNALALRNDIFQHVDERTDPVKSVIPFLAGFGFCFFGFAAITIKTNMFLLRKLTMISVEDG